MKGAGGHQPECVWDSLQTFENFLQIDTGTGLELLNVLKVTSISGLSFSAEKDTVNYLRMAFPPSARESISNTSNEISDRGSG